ncbi:MAG: DNA polymerase III subunit delta [Parcubacteria group bacterium Gr01-1014_31]|nr:MAG: DNA polymerase III subunit delta [Parcubacteria group bacterium Gr01-1014_31]
MVIFLHGADTFRSRGKLRQIKERFRREVDKTGYNTAALDGKRLKVEDLEQALLAAPFLAPKRLVMVEEFFGGKPTAAVEKQVLELVQRPAAATAVAVFWEGELPATRKGGALLSFLRESPYAEQFEPLQGMPLAAWYRTRAKHHGAQFAPGAMERLMDCANNDLWRADGELAKLSAYCHGRAATIPDVQELASSDVEENVFALTDAIGQRRTTEALRLLQEQQRAGVSTPELVAKITWHCRNLLLAKAWISDHPNQGTSWAMADALRLHPFVAKKTLGQVTNFTLAELETRYRALLTLDRASKSSRANGSALLTLWLTTAAR